MNGLAVGCYSTQLSNRVQFANLLSAVQICAQWLTHDKLCFLPHMGGWGHTFLNSCVFFIIFFYYLPKIYNQSCADRETVLKLILLTVLRAQPVTRAPLIPTSVQSSFRIMDMCHSRPTNAIFDALNQNTIHFPRPPVAPAASSGLPLGYSNIPVHTQVRYWRRVCLFNGEMCCPTEPGDVSLLYIFEICLCLSVLKSVTRQDYCC